MRVLAPLVGLGIVSFAPLAAAQSADFGRDQGTHQARAHFPVAQLPAAQSPAAQLPGNTRFVAPSPHPPPPTYLPPPPAPEPPEAPEPQPGMPSGETAQAGARTLLGHTFPYPRLAEVPFTASSFKVGTAIDYLSQAGVSNTGTQTSGDVESLLYDRSLAFIRLDYGAEIAPHERFSFGLDADYLAMVGANEESLFLYGGQTGFDFRPFMRGAVYRDEERGVQLGIGGFGTFESGLRAVPQGLLVELSEQVDAIADDETGARARCLADGNLGCAFEDDANLAQAMQLTRRRFGGGGTVALGWAINSVLASQLGVRAEGARTTVSSAILGDVAATDVRVGASFAPSLDLSDWVPITLALAYRFEVQRSAYDGRPELGIDDGQEIVAMGHRASAGIYYAGRQDLMLGWSAMGSILEDTERGVAQVTQPAGSTSILQRQPNAMVASAQFDMRYFF